MAYLFIYNLFISEIHSPSSKKSEDLNVTHWVLILEKLKDRSL